MATKVKISVNESYLFREGQVCFIEGPDCSNVLPIVSKYKCLGEKGSNKEKLHSHMNISMEVEIKKARSVQKFFLRSSSRTRFLLGRCAPLQLQE